MVDKNINVGEVVRDTIRERTGEVVLAFPTASEMRETYPETFGHVEDSFDFHTKIGVVYFDVEDDRPFFTAFYQKVNQEDN